MRRILISGGGPAGAATAFWLAKAGFGVTVVERSTAEPCGQGIDVQNSAVEVARRMGLLETIKTKTTGETGFALVDDDGNDIGFMGVTPAEGAGKNAPIGAPSQEIEV
jgi:2-polyprenyl-6-methoxyphenol hydroxylase-like FAD-dependent oxidoreductase